MNTLITTHLRLRCRTIRCVTVVTLVPFFVDYPYVASCPTLHTHYVCLHLFPYPIPFPYVARILPTFFPRLHLRSLTWFFLAGRCTFATTTIPRRAPSYAPGYGYTACLVMPNALHLALALPLLDSLVDLFCCWCLLFFRWRRICGLLPCTALVGPRCCGLTQDLLIRLIQVILLCRGSTALNCRTVLRLPSDSDRDTNTVPRLLLVASCCYPILVWFNVCYLGVGSFCQFALTRT